MQNHFILVYILPEKQSILDAMEHLLARYLEILPLFFEPALPIKLEWNINPYFGVLPRVFNALQWNSDEKCSHNILSFPVMLQASDFFLVY